MYFLMGFINFITLIKNKLLSLNEIIFFTLLSALGGSVFVGLGTYIIKKYKIFYVVIFIVFALGIANIISGLWYIIV